MNKNILFLSILSLFLACHTPVNNTDLQGQLAEVDTIFADWTRARPGGAFGIIKDGRLLYEKYFGLANMEKGEPFSSKTITDIGSISKQFTAMCIALLEEKGQLSLEDDIRKYLPEFPKYREVVKIKHLLFHTSGIKDQEELMLLKGLEPYGAYMTNDFALQLIIKQQTPNFPSASKYEYSNANYVLLTEIIKRVSGEPLEEFAKAQIFEPLGMENTFFNLNQGADFDLKAIGYIPDGNDFKKEFYETHVIGDGGIYTTLEDMVKWDANFYRNQLGKGQQSLVKRMQFREELSNGRLNNMAFAQINTLHHFGKESWSHGGGGGGYRSFYIRFESDKFSVIVLSNADNSNSFNKANQVVNLFLDNNKKGDSNPPKNEKKVTIPAIEVSKEDYQHFNGFYINEERILVLKIEPSIEGNQFIIKWLDGDGAGYAAQLINTQTIAEQEDTDYQYKLNLEKNLLTHEISGRTDIVFKKLPPFNTDLKAYKGHFSSKELDHTIKLEIDEKRLVSTNNYCTQLEPISNDIFMDKRSKSVISFKRNAANKVVNFVINIPRGDRNLKHIVFSKEKK